MIVEIKKNDQLFVNDKWYFDILDINDNIVQARVRYKENPNIENYTYKAINLDKTLFLNVEKDTDSNIIRCTIDERELRKTVGTLLTRLKIEMDYSFVYEEASVANSSNAAGMGDVVAPGINPIPGQTGTAGSGDIGTVMGASTKMSTLGKNYNKHYKDQQKKKKKKKKKIDNILKVPIIYYEAFGILDNDIKTKLLNILDYPEKNKTDILFIDDLKSKKDDLINSSKPVIQKYLSDLKELNSEKFEECSVWLKNDIESIINYE